MWSPMVMCALWSDWTQHFLKGKFLCVFISTVSSSKDVQTYVIMKVVSLISAKGELFHIAWVIVTCDCMLWLDDDPELYCDLTHLPEGVSKSTNQTQGHHLIIASSILWPISKSSKGKRSTLCFYLGVSLQLGGSLARGCL